MMGGSKRSTYKHDVHETMQAHHYATWFITSHFRRNFVGMRERAIVYKIRRCIFLTVIHAFLPTFARAILEKNEKLRAIKSQN